MVTVMSHDLANEMHSCRVFLSHSPPAPGTRDKAYGWAEYGMPLKLTSTVRIEERTGLYGGPYVGSIGAPNYGGLCTIGAFSYSYSALPEYMTVGRYCSISKGLKILDSAHPTDRLSTSAAGFRPHNWLWSDLAAADTSAVDLTWDIYQGKQFPVIGNDVWIGQDVALAMGIEIGTGAIVAANSVVTKDVAPYSIVSGNPARERRLRFDVHLIESLINSQWWRQSPALVMAVISKNPVDAINLLAHKGEQPWAPSTMLLTHDGWEVSRTGLRNMTELQQ